MAKQVMIQPWDDLDFKSGVRTPAQVEDVVLSFDGQAVELDLSAENWTRLSEFLRPFLAAGRKPGDAATASAGRSSRSGPTARYFEGMRRFADTRGFEYRPQEKGGWYYPPALRRAYSDHLRSLEGKLLDGGGVPVPAPEVKAGESAEAQQAAQEEAVADEVHRQDSSVVPRSEEYFEGMRRFADENGIRYQYPNGNAYSPKLHAAYQEYLSKLPEAV